MILAVHLLAWRNGLKNPTGKKDKLTTLVNKDRLHIKYYNKIQK